MGEVEMKYKLWAGEEKKPWQAMKDGSTVVLDRLPPGTPSVMRPENEAKNCPDPETMDCKVKHLSQRMTGEDVQWWKEFIESERRRRVVWEAMNGEDYQEAGKSFSVASLQCRECSSEGETDDEDLLKTESHLEHLLAKSLSMKPIVRGKLGGLCKKGKRKKKSVESTKKRQRRTKQPRTKQPS
ncbi:uncharacterized protein LOC110249782 [Exaiptasia diaphana]|uniref:Uncharacterized protein n=1 Tax=Exaiptasia diaphana TaxID=2652724 RepID=A0A913XZ26_EXADI|nr:uncharacterized protein LOC110249782 [Exaiptasia diaphana]